MSTEKKTISVRVPADTYNEFEEYREERGGISKADAGRRLLQIGIQQQNPYPAILERVGWVLLAAVAALYLFNFTLLAGVVAAVAGVVFLAGAVIEIRRLLTVRFGTNPPGWVKQFRGDG